MSSDGQRAARERLAAQGKAHREKERAVAEQSEQDSRRYQQEKQADLRRVTYFRAFTSTSHPFTPWVVLFLMFWIPIVFDEDTKLEAWRWPYLSTIALLWAWYFTGPLRWRLARGALPFSVEGVEVLFTGEFIARVRVELEYVDGAMPAGTLSDLVAARLPGSTSSDGADAKSVTSGELEVGSNNYRGVRWVRQALRLLREVHQGWPLKRVVVRARERREFYVPAGD